MTLPDEKEPQGYAKKDSKFFSDVLKLVTGSAVIQVIRIVLSPILSRLFAPAAFGVLQNYLAIAKPVGVNSSLRYERAIMLPKDRKYAANMFVLAMGLSILVSLLLLVFVWLGGGQVADALNSPELANYLWFLPLSVAAIGIFEALRQWNSLERKYTRLSITQIWNELLGDGLTAGFGFAGFTSGGLMIGMQLVGQIFSTLAFFGMVFKEDAKYIKDSFDWAIVKQGLYEYRRLPMFNMVSNLISNAALYIPSMLLSAYFSTTVAGYYAMGNNAIRLPISVIGNSLGQVFFQRGAKAYHENGLKSIMEGTMKYLILMSMFPMLLIAIIGKEMFVLAFGASWADAGVYSQILSLWVFLVFIVSPISYVPNIVNKNGEFMVLNIINLITRVLSLVIGGIKGDVYLGLWLFTLSGILVYGYMMFWLNGLSGMRASQTVRYLSKTFIGCLPFLLAVAAFKLWNPVAHTPVTGLKFPLDYLALMLVALVAGLVYVYLFILRDKTIKSEMGRMLGLIKAKKS